MMMSLKSNVYEAEGILSACNESIVIDHKGLER